MLNLGKGLLIGVVTVFAAVVALQAILAGGREVRGGLAVVYALIAAAGCFVLGLVQRRAARRTVSPLLQVDFRAWFVDGAISVGVALAFAISLLLEGTRAAWLVPYVDPGVVIGLALASSPVPLGIVRANWSQLLGRAPEAAIQREAQARVNQALDGIPGVTPHLRLLETGRTFYLQLYLVAGPDAPLSSIEEMDRLRQRVLRSVRREGESVGLDVIFTRDPRWLRETTPTQRGPVRSGELD
jgi:predicted Co/Zn/Cd cation transporter (cation efflux family)